MMGYKQLLYIGLKILADIFIQVRIGEMLSGRYMVENGIPQGSIKAQYSFQL